MGLKISLPVVKETACYLISSGYTSTGEKREDETVAHKKWVGGAIKEFIKDVLKKRAAIVEAKQKFLDTDYAYLKKCFPQWTSEDIMDLKVQFQSFDLNYDGLIDFEEMCLGLDEMGDKSSYEERKENFEATDVDQSGAVDFEEYLVVLAKSLQETKLVRDDVTNPSHINRLTVLQQLELEVF